MAEKDLTFISDIIDMSKFKVGELNLISSGCGTGKTYFVANNLLRRYPEIKPYEVLFLTSRAMIVEQQSKTNGVDKFSKHNIEAVRFWNGETENPSALRGNGIQIMTYDKIIRILTSQNTPEYETLSRVKIVVIDECHTLFSDTFISNIECLKVWIRDCLYNREKIFIGMTATPEILTYYCDEKKGGWGVVLNKINDIPLVNYRAKQLHCINFRTIPYLFATNRIIGKTIIMCTSVADCIELQNKLYNAAVLVSPTNKYNCPEMVMLRKHIVDWETLPETFEYHIDLKDPKHRIKIEPRKLEILITTSTAREGINLREKSGIRNVISCFTDELHISQFMGRCRYDIDNLVVADTFMRSDNYDTDSYLSQNRRMFKDFINNKENAAWFNSIAHLIQHDIYGIKRLFLGTEEGKFIDYINTKWLVPIPLGDENLDRFKIYKEEDKKEIINKSVESKIFPLCKSRVTFNRVISLLKECFGYEIESGIKTVRGSRYTYKLIISFDEDKITYTPVYETIDT